MLIQLFLFNFVWSLISWDDINNNWDDGSYIPREFVKQKYDVAEARIESEVLYNSSIFFKTSIEIPTGGFIPVFFLVDTESVVFLCASIELWNILQKHDVLKLENGSYFIHINHRNIVPVSECGGRELENVNVVGMRLLNYLGLHINSSSASFSHKPGSFTKDGLKVNLEDGIEKFLGNEKRKKKMDSIIPRAGLPFTSFDFPDNEDFDLERLIHVGDYEPTKDAPTMEVFHNMRKEHPRILFRSSFQLINGDFLPATFFVNTRASLPMCFSTAFRMLLSRTDGILIHDRKEETTLVRIDEEYAVPIQKCPYPYDNVNIVGLTLIRHFGLHFCNITTASFSHAPAYFPREEGGMVDLVSGRSVKEYWYTEAGVMREGKKKGSKSEGKKAEGEGGEREI